MKTYHLNNNQTYNQGLTLLARNLNEKSCSALALLIVFLFGFTAQAQLYPFRNFSTNEGLSTNKIISIYESKDNRLWLGSTEGINIYDGNTFQSNNELFRLPNRNVYDVTEIKNKFYISTNGGLCVYDGADTMVFRTSSGLKHNRVFKTFLDRDSVIWVATQNGVHILENNKLQNVNIHPVVNDGPIYNIYEDKKGALWFCSVTSGVVRYHNNTATQFLNMDYPSSFVGDILYINDSTHWASTRRGVFKIENNQVSSLDVGAPEKTNFYDLHQCSNGNIWISSDQGVFVYRNNKFQRFTTENGLIDNEILKVFEDSEHSVWFVSTSKGISQLINEKLILFSSNTFRSTKINSTIYKNDSILFLGSGGEIYEFNRHQYTTKTFVDSNAVQNVQNASDYQYLNGFYDDKSKKLIIGSNNEISVLDEKHNFSKIKVNNTAHGRLAKVWSIQQDDQGKLWMGTSSGIGYLKDSVITFYKSPNNYHEFTLGTYKAKSGIIYFATERGLSYLENGELHHYSKKHNFHKARIRQITEDLEGNIWFAGEKGLFRQVNDTFIEVPYREVCPDPIQSITFDKEGKLWAGVSNGILRFDFDKEKPSLQYFDHHSGFLGKECNLSAIQVTSDNKVYVGTDLGLVVYQPEYDFHRKIKPKFKLSMSVLGIENFEDYSDSIDDFGLPINLILPGNNNQVNFNYTLISLLCGKEAKFSYMLEGFEKSWNSSQNDKKITYNELPYGTYTFRIKVLEHPNLHATPEHTITFTIKKPFYLQAWFIIICIGIVITWVYSYYVIRKNVRLLHIQKTIVEKKNKEVHDSIVYAKRIQDTILPKSSILEESFKNYFVLYTPRDIVSGDFYWVESVGDEIVFAAADCTGHGVPGAMVSLMCSNLLRKVIVEGRVTDPGQVLDTTSELLLERLGGKSVSDGMDISLCFWNRKTKTLKFAGANNPLFLIRNGELQETKADKQPIGYFEDRVPFTTHLIDYQEGDQIVIFSDGLKDQFGGPKNKKFSTKRFKNLLCEISNQNLEAQGEKLLGEFVSWKGDEEQVDDICVFSVVLK